MVHCYRRHTRYQIFRTEIEFIRLTFNNSFIKSEFKYKIKRLLTNNYAPIPMAIHQKTNRLFVIHVLWRPVRNGWEGTLIIMVLIAKYFIEDDIKIVFNKVTIWSLFNLNICSSRPTLWSSLIYEFCCTWVQVPSLWEPESLYTSSVTFFS